MYGFYHIDVCHQSPVIIQFQSATPFRLEPIDGIYVFDYDLYNRVLGRGRAQGSEIRKPDPSNPGYDFVSIRNAQLRARQKRIFSLARKEHWDIFYNFIDLCVSSSELAVGV